MAKRGALRVAEFSGKPASAIEEAIPRGPRWLLEEFRKRGFEAYIIGGACRDVLTGSKPRDWDVLTSAPTYKVARLFRGAKEVGKRHRIALVPVPGGSNVEVSSLASFSIFRSDPFANFDNASPSLSATSERSRLFRLQREARRRDFTVNALVYDPSRRSVLDFCSGVPDARAQIVRTIANPRASFKEDPARIMRAIRVASRWRNGQIEKNTKRELRALASMVHLCSHGRLHREVCMCLGTGAAESSFKLMWRHGVLDEVLPELAETLASKGVPRAPRKRRNEGPLHRLLSALDNEQQSSVLNNTGESMPSEAILAALALPISRTSGVPHEEVCESLWRNVGRSGWSPPKHVARRAASLLDERGEELGALAHGGESVQAVQRAPLFASTGHADA